MKKILIWIFGILVLLGCLGTAVLFLVGNSEEETGYQLYYLSQDEDQLISVYHDAEEADPSALAAELYVLQQTLPEDNADDVKLLLPESVILLNLSLEDNLLLLNFSSEYYDMSTEREILVRAGMVRLFTQISEVEKIQFQVEGEPLISAEGIEAGTMTADRFVENSGKEINSYTKSAMTLYFADESQTKLVAEERSVYYNSNVPLERVVVEQLINGPQTEGHYAVLPSDLNILSVTIQDEICYVNLDNSFVSLLEQSSSTLNPELAVYAVVSSLTDTCRVSKIQISVNGNTNVDIGSVNLGNLLSKREDLIQDETEDETEDEIEEAAG